MDEPEREPQHGGESLTREDVLRLIDEHGGPEGLDLRHADLRELDLHGAVLRGANLQGASLLNANLQETDLPWANLQYAGLQTADLHEANLQGADLRGAYLQGATLLRTNLQGAYLVATNSEGAYLFDANIQGADLRWANLQQADLRWAKLQGADLRRADLRRARLAYASVRDANLQGANWGDYVLGDEIGDDFGGATAAYGALKQWHAEAGMYDIAGEFHYREMEAHRKFAWSKRRLPYALGMYLLRFLYGYGERPLLVIAWAAAVILGFALGHWAFGTAVAEHCLSGSVTGGCTVADRFLDALYYSAVSFTALGYGHWAAEPQGWAGKFLGVGESLLGVFMMALFLVTFTRKMTR